MSEENDQDPIIPGEDSALAEKYPIEPTEVQEKILEIARELMQKHYVLDSRKLYYLSLRALKDTDKIVVMKSIDDLIRKKVLFPGKAVSRDNLLKNQKRNEILNLIIEEPGIYFAKIRKELGLDSNTLLWHLKMLEKFDFIRSEKFGNSTVFFDYFLDKEHDTLHYYLHKDKSIDIFKEIITNPGLSFQDLLYHLDMPRTTLIRKLKALIENGLLKVAYEANRIISINVVHDYKELVLVFVYKKYWNK
ncbi:MAG: winged helix-turn-helix transcriptional regulator [Candidatus Hodarchaeota archaeon]